MDTKRQQVNEFFSEGELAKGAALGLTGAGIFLGSKYLLSKRRCKKRFSNDEAKYKQCMKTWAAK